MKNKTREFPEDAKSEPEFADPARTPWVWVGFALLFAALLPVWPIPGNWWGIPAWAVFAVMASALTSAFTVFVIFRVWKEPGPCGRGSGDDGR